MGLFDLDPNQRIYLMIISLMAISIPSTQAFPLNGGNGLVNATVYGVMDYEYGDGIYIDISASDTDVYDTELVSEDGSVYGGDSVPYRSDLHGFPTETSFKGSIRDTLLFNVPKNIIIKHLKIIPSQSDPFYIKWSGVPQVSGNNETFSLNSATFESNGMRWRQGNWILDVNITNNANNITRYNSSDFALVDQFGWVYSGEKGDNWRKIPAGESLRITAKIPLVSEKSRPDSILFKGMKLDISEWV